MAAATSNAAGGTNAWPGGSALRNPFQTYTASQEVPGQKFPLVFSGQSFQEQLSTLQESLNAPVETSPTSHSADPHPASLTPLLAMPTGLLNAESVIPFSTVQVIKSTVFANGIALSASIEFPYPSSPSADTPILPADAFERPSEALAQPLPDTANAEFDGKIEPNASFMKVTTDSPTESIQFSLKVEDSGGPMPIFKLLDSSGNQYASLPAPGNSNMLVVTLSNLQRLPSNSIYLELTPSGGSQGGGVSTPLNFQLWVSRSNTSSIDPTIDSGATLSALYSVASSFTTANLGANPLLDSSETMDSQFAIATNNAYETESAPALLSTETSGETEVGGEVPQVVASGPLPTLTTIARGGILGDGAATVSAETPTMAALDDEAPLERQLKREGDVGTVAFVEQLEESSSRGDRGVVAISGPGGFPLLGAASADDWSEKFSPNRTSGESETSQIDRSQTTDVCPIHHSTQVPAKLDNLEVETEPRAWRWGRGTLLLASVFWLFDPASIFHWVIENRASRRVLPPWRLRRREESDKPTTPLS